MGSVSFQPSFGVAYKGLEILADGNVGLTETSDPKEIDVTLSYTIGGLCFGITDYWSNQGLDLDNRYFRYNAHSTNHVFEVNLGYDFGVVAIQWNTNFAGFDGLNKNCKRAYSSYVELNVPFRLGGAEWTATAAAVPYATTYYNTNGFAVTLLWLKATKEIQITDRFSIPVFAKVLANPCAQKGHLAFGFTLR